jgi:hypothetical protein
MLLALRSLFEQAPQGPLVFDPRFQVNPGARAWGVDGAPRSFSVNPVRIFQVTS